MVDPSNIFAIDDIKFLTGYRIEALVASESSMKQALDMHYGTTKGLDTLLEGMETEGVEYIGEEETVNISNLKEASEDAPGNKAG